MQRVGKCYHHDAPDQQASLRQISLLTELLCMALQTSVDARQLNGSVDLVALLHFGVLSSPVAVHVNRRYGSYGIHHRDFGTSPFHSGIRIAGQGWHPCPRGVARRLLELDRDRGRLTAAILI
jgi:hypothetical protein